MRTTFFDPTSTVAPMRSFATLLSAIVATVLLPTATVAAPTPTKTSFLPATVRDAVHLPAHLIAPAPYAAPAGLHLPVFELLSAATKVLVILRSPLCPLPTQSNTWAVPVNATPLANLRAGAFLADDA